MSGKHKRGNLSSTPSLLSIASSADLSVKEETLPSPTTLTECDDLLETYQLRLQGKSKEKTNMINHIKQLRAEKEPLLKVKSTIQEEISSAIHLINTKSEEVTHLRQKLRHHSERQIYDNIDRLEVQLRNNNYKPREEQKILDEICMLKRSFKTLREFELKQRENKKLRSERSRLIDQRNEVFSKIQAIILQEEEMKKEITEMRHIITASMRTVDHLKALRPDLERAYLNELRQREEVKQKRIKEKARARKEQYILRQQERQKRWEEYEASREPYEEEKDMCRMLIAYLQSALPSDPTKTDPREEGDLPTVESSLHSKFPAINESQKTDSNLPSKPFAKDSSLKIESTPLSLVLPEEDSPKSNSNLPTKSSVKSYSSRAEQGSFYCKPKDEPPEKPRGKRKKAKARREFKAGKIRELSHPPDALANLGTLNVPIPRTTEDVLSCLDQIESKFRHFTLLGEKEKESLVNGEEEKSSKGTDSPSNAVAASPRLPTKENHPDDKTIDEKFLPSKIESPVTPILTGSLPLSTLINQPDCSLMTAPSQFLLNSTPVFPLKSDLISDLSCPKSFFSIALPVVRSKQLKKEPSFAPTYASVAAKVHV